MVETRSGAGKNGHDEAPLLPVQPQEAVGVEAREDPQPSTSGTIRSKPLYRSASLGTVFSCKSSSSTKSQRERRRQELALEEEEELEKIELQRLLLREREVRRRKQIEQLRLDSESDGDETTGAGRILYDAMNPTAPEYAQGREVDRAVAAKTSGTGRILNDTMNPAVPEYAQGTEVCRAVAATSQESSAVDRLANEFLKMSPARRVTELPIFNGSACDWLNFKAAFVEGSELYSLSKMENVQRLRKALVGEAKEAVSALLYTCSNPEEIVSALERRFGRPSFIIHSQMSQIKALPKLKDNEPLLLATFASRIQNFYVSVKSLKMTAYLSSPELLGIILQKFTTILHSKFVTFASGACPDEEPNLKLVVDFLNTEADAACKFACLSEVEKPPVTFAGGVQPPRKPEYKSGKPRVATYHAAESVPAAPNQKKDAAPMPKVTPDKVKCPCEKDSHAPLPKCPKFKSMAHHERWYFILDNNLCFRCLDGKHIRRFCSAERCSVEGCGKPHHELLHRDAASAVVSKVDCLSHQALLKVLPVVVKGPKGEVSTYALMDDGSNVTLLDEDLASHIGAQGVTSTLRIAGIQSNSSIRSRDVEVSIRNGCTENDSSFVVRAKTMPSLSLTPQTVTKPLTEFQHLHGLPLPTYEGARPRLLIGQDNLGLLLPNDIKRGKDDEPVASLTLLGWVLHGNVKSFGSNVGHAGHLVMHVRSKDDDIAAIVRQGFALDALGVSVTPRKSKQDERAVEILDRTSQLKDGRWHIGLPFVSDDVTFPRNRNEALKRLHYIEMKCKRDETFASAYEAQIQNLLDQDYAEECAGPGIEGRTWYLPHFGVTNPNKPGKLRTVFDAASRFQGVCLNDKLLTGPTLLQSLLGVLFRFRQGAVAVTADLKEMFLRIKIHEEDRDCQRFLWRNVTGRGEVRDYRMSSMIFGASSSPFSAIFIVNKNASSIKETHPRAFKAITRNQYVDDYTDSFASVEEARDVVLKVFETYKSGGFELRGWASNNKTILECFPQELRAKGEIDLFDESTPPEKILGVMWKPGPDVLGFNTKAPRVSTDVIHGKEVPTKRQLLATVMSFFDPLGLVTPLTISGRILLQDVWRSALGWDERLQKEHARRWLSWLRAIGCLSELHVPRCYFPVADAQCRVELHTFVDASEQAFTAACYWRFLAPVISCSLIISKSRVCPLRPVSTPRLELQAAVLGARLADTVVREHDITPVRTVFWSDSATVIAWIRSDARTYKAFVANRLGEIDELTNPEQWRWVPGTENPADLGTRDTVSELTAESEWFVGPAFLKKDESEWPASLLAKPDLPQCEQKLIVNVLTEEPLALPDPKRFSKWLSLINATAYVLAFIARAKRQDVDFVELKRRAERLWVKQMQRECYPTEYACLTEGRPLPSKSSLLQLSPYFDEEGILRVRGRVDLVENVPRQVKRPILLGRHIYTDLFLGHCHRKYLHGSTETVLNEVRQRYWVPRLRSRLRYVVHRCVLCRARLAKPACPPVGDLPLERLAHHKRPFTYCGLDYFGPLYVKIGRRQEKRYGALFTCLTCRACHVELVASLSTDSVIMALRRMMARRGCPNTIYSDNGSNFHGSEKELRLAWQEMSQQDATTWAASSHSITWKFIPAAAPHFGGAWERLIEAVKRALYAVMKERAPKEEVLQTLVAEAENIVNSRPLTHVSISPNDLEALTPNHFLLGCSSGSPVPGVFTDQDILRRKDWRVAQRLADFFWGRWVREYLPLLRTRVRNSNGSEQDLKVGDIVIIADQRLPRNAWPKGIIDSTHPGRDGRVRVVQVRTHAGTYSRPANKIIKLPVEEQEDEDGRAPPLHEEGNVDNAGSDLIIF